MEKGRPFAHMVEAVNARAWLESTKERGMALGLEHTARAVEALGLPAPAYETVHVAGSNGKGTTVAALGSALHRIGCRHVSFTSPHLVRVEERVRLDGRPVSTAVFDAALADVHAMAARTGLSLTFFEVTLLVALVVAADQRPDVLVLETGLGGRLDATRAVPADLAIITSLSLEHTDVLGGTLEAIAAEKAAIARPMKPMFVRDVADQGARRSIQRAADEAGNPEIGEQPAAAQLHWVEIEPEADYFDEARAMAAAAWGSLTCAEKTKFPNFRGLHWTGRMHEVVRAGSGQRWLLEGAHNPSGMETSCRALQREERWKNPWALLFGSTPQSEMGAMLEPLVNLCRRHPPVAIVLTEPQFGRYPGVPCTELANALGRHDLQISASFANPQEAVAWVEARSSTLTDVLCIGSLYLAGNVLQALGADDDEALSIVAKD